MEVKAIFELPVHIWVMYDALDATHPTGYDKLRFNVVMPNDRPPVGGPLLFSASSRAPGWSASRSYGCRNTALTFPSRFGQPPRFIVLP